MDNFIKNMVQDMYDSQASIDVYEMENTRFSANISVANLLMLDAISKHFQRTRADVVDEILNASVMSMFIALDQNEKDVLSKLCDEQFEEHMQKIATQNKGTYSYSGVGRWTAYAQAFANKEAEQDANANG